MNIEHIFRNFENRLEGARNYLAVGGLALLAVALEVAPESTEISKEFFGAGIAVLGGAGASEIGRHIYKGFREHSTDKIV